MPKNNRVTKVDNVIRKQKVAAKLRIGSRKGGKSAIAMSTEELQGVLETKDKRRWHDNARVVLRSRGIV